MNNGRSTTLPRTLAAQLLKHAQQGGDNEICGLVSVKQTQNSPADYRYHPITNIAADKPYRYIMDPSEQISTMRDIRDSGGELFAIYHSHPTSAAIPSATDMAESGYPEVLYLITSLNTKGVLEMRGFRLLEDGYDEIDLLIE
jgi:proteasome lid subunit RPN8/RPN11